MYSVPLLNDAIQPHETTCCPSRGFARSVCRCVRMPIHQTRLSSSYTIGCTGLISRPSPVVRNFTQEGAPPRKAVEMSLVVTSIGGARLSSGDPTNRVSAYPLHP